jgi:hypothetical protein
MHRPCNGCYPACHLDLGEGISHRIDVGIDEQIMPSPIGVQQTKGTLHTSVCNANAVSLKAWGVCEATESSAALLDKSWFTPQARSVVGLWVEYDRSCRNKGLEIVAQGLEGQ